MPAEHGRNAQNIVPPCCFTLELGLGVQQRVSDVVSLAASGATSVSPPKIRLKAMKQCVWDVGEIQASGLFH